MLNNSLPATGYLRQKQIIPGIVEVAPATLWRWVRKGTFPAPVKLGERVTAWRVESVREWMAQRDATVSKAVH
jgi:predicted DNA-binding transcriptional regulator AlpA